MYIETMVELGSNASKREISAVEEHGFMHAEVGTDGRIVTHYLKGLSRC